MKYFILFAALCAVALARPNSEAQIVSLDSEVQPDSYKYSFETSDGTKQEAEGHLNDAGTDHESLAVRGSFSYVDEKDGQTYSVTYVADDNGFQPKGAHLPVSP